MTDRTNPHIAILVRDLEASRIDRREFVRYAALLGMAAPAAYALAGEITGEPFAPPAAAEDMPKGGKIVIGSRVKEISSPHTYSWGGYDSNISRQVVEYVTRIDTDGVTKPYLAEKWEVSDDLKSWTFHLRKDVKWSNGDPFTADDVIWNLKRMTDPAVGSSVIGLVKGYLLEEYDTGKKDDKGAAVMSTKLWTENAIEKVDDHTVRLNCKTANVAVPEHLFHYPAAILHPKDNGVFGVGSIGTGAFTLAEFELGKRALLKKKEGYWGGDAHLDEIEFVDTGDDVNAPIAAYASKQIHGQTITDPLQVKALNAMPHLQFYTTPTAETAVLRMNITNKPFDNKMVRQAMRYAIDAQQVVDVAIQGLGTAGEHTHVSTVHPDYGPIPPFKRDVEKAKKLLADAGFPNGIESEIFVPTDLAWIQNQAEAAIEQWKEAGINVKLNLMPGAQYWDVWTKVPLGGTIWFHRSPGFITLALAYRTGVPWNETGYANKEFDDILTKAEGTVDANKRKEYLTKLELIMQDDGPIVQPIFQNAYTFYDKRVKGFAMHPTKFVFGERLAITA
jgi:peptide/nickel transport system substrate-binding protein